MDEIVKEFLVESYENLDRLDRALVELEKDPSHKESLDSIFRTIHTIKGTCGFIGFSKLEKVAHVGENLLSRLRDGTLRLNPEITSALLAMVDAVRAMLSNIEAVGNEGTGEYPELIERLTSLCASGETKSQLQSISVTVTASELGPVLKDEIKPGSAPESRLQSGTSSKELTTKNPPMTEINSAEINEAKASAVSDANIRVDVNLLDKLMNLVGELVLARNQILQFTSSQKDPVFVATSQRLNLITTELQEGVMKTRMQPIGNIWNKFPRVVRDLAFACGKQVDIQMEGKETDLDKTIIEAIKDPLTHLVRNAVDHGIELPQDRIYKSKPPIGKLSLRAFHEGGQVNIEISDDGAGINPEKVKNHAIKKGLITVEEASRMSDRELIQLIFLPGFSTAEKVTSISGRGVGMDVVKTNIEKIGGTVDVQSKLGEGSTIKIKIPLTLAIIPALIVTSGGDRYAIPQVSLLELVRLEGEQARNGVEMIHGAPVYRLRGNLLPLVYLNQVLQLDHRRSKHQGSVGTEEEIVNIVVLQADIHQFGLVVEGINDTEEIVVKPLGKQLKGISSFAGATIMGDGKVALILDILGIAQRAHVISEVRERNKLDKESKSKEQEDLKRSLLLFGLNRDDRVAIPLSMVARLEEFPRSAVERANTRTVVQYRDQIMPLIDLSSVLSSGAPSAEVDAELMQVIVYTHEGRSVGLVVDRIIDIVEENVTIKRHACTSGFLGSAVIQQRVTDLLDVEGVIRSIDPAFFSQTIATN